MAAFRAELQKAHRRHDLALCLLIPGIVVLWVGGLAPADPEELANGYSALLYSLPVIEAILMPVMMAVLASRLWDMEIKGNTAKLLPFLAGKAARLVSAQAKRRGVGLVRVNDKMGILKHRIGKRVHCPFAGRPARAGPFAVCKITACNILRRDAAVVHTAGRDKIVHVICAG